jgi:cupin 2 domain-containing protein
MRNLFADLPADVPEELVEILVEDQQVRIEQIISTGQSSPDGFWYDQDEHECVIVLKGEAKLLYEGDAEPIHMKPGDYINIPAHRKHRVEWTSPDEPTVWLAVFY